MFKIQHTLAGICTAAIFSGPAAATPLWDSAQLVTHPGAGPGGSDVSMADTSGNRARNQNVSDFGDWHRLADSFNVDQPGWLVDAITVYIVPDLRGDPTPQWPYWHSVDLNIWKDTPGSGELLANANRPVTLDIATHTGIHRVDKDMEWMSIGDQPIWEITLNLGEDALTLTDADADYWIDLQVDTRWGGAFVPAAMLPNPEDPNSPIAVQGNVLHRDFSGLWKDWLIESGGENLAMPFQVHGQVIPEPTAAALMGVGGLLLLRRNTRQRSWARKEG